jgi:hypothetical protein
VETLQKSQHEERLEAMILQCKALHEENGRLRHIIASITRLARGVEEVTEATDKGPEQQRKESSEPGPADSERNNPRSNSNSNEFLSIAPRQEEHQQPQIFLEEPGMELVHRTFSAYPVPSPTQLSDHFGHEFHLERHNSMGISPVNHNSLGISPPNHTSDGSSPIIAYESENVFVAVNHLIRKAESLTIPPMKPDQEADIAIRAVNHGWNVTEERYELDAVWQIVRQIVQDIFAPCGAIEKLALLRLLRLKILQVRSLDMMLFQNLLTRPTANHEFTSATTSDSAAAVHGLKVALHPTQYFILGSLTHHSPVQNYIVHPSVIDYFVW